MKKPPIPLNEEERLKALYEYHIIDSEEEKVFNTIINLAASICHVPISSVTLIDRNRQWHKAFMGLPPEAREAPRDIAFCSYTILSNEFLEVVDATTDERFKDNPLVLGQPNIRFYGGMPLISPEGYKIGTLCVIDNKPKQLTKDQKKKLKQLSKIAMALMEAKKIMANQLIQKEKMTDELQIVNDKLGKQLIEQQENYLNLSILSQMNGMLESCLERGEAFAVIKHFCQLLFPRTQGYIYLMQQNRDYIELDCQWGQDNNPEQICIPEDCWALRRGQVYIFEKQDCNLRCAHLKNCNDYLCLPLIAQGETLGLLSLVFSDKEETNKKLTETEKLLCTTMGEQVALAIANINLRQSLRAKSTIDPLTGLYNRRYMAELFTREILKALRRKTSLILSLIDIDHFKKFNDTYGHEAGDAVLKHVSKFLREYTDDHFVCRLGGEEFVLIFRNKTIDEVFNIVEKIRIDIANTELTYMDKKLERITISQGLAVFPKDAKTLENLLLKADKALYKAKSNGRNCTVVHS